MIGTISGRSRQKQDSESRITTSTNRHDVSAEKQISKVRSRVLYRFETVDSASDRDSVGIRLISLDNDLDMIEVDGNWIDQGEGRDVARWLSAHSAVCPVVIHATNMPADDQMMDTLKASHWSVDRVVPFEGERWIDETWASAVKRLLR